MGRVCGCVCRCGMCGEQCRRACSTYIFSPAHGIESHLTLPFCHPDLLKHRANHRSISLPQAIVSRAYRQTGRLPQLRVQPIALSSSSIVVIETLPQQILPPPPPLCLVTPAQAFKIRHFHGQSINQTSNRIAPRHSQHQRLAYLKQQDLRARHLPANDSSATALNCSPQTDPPENCRVQDLSVAEDHG